jgi:hypothetical protein
MSPEQMQQAKILAIRLAHRALADALKYDLAIDQPIIGKAITVEGSLQVAVVLAPCDGPLPAVPAGLPTALPLRDVEMAALRAAPGPSERPISVRALARLAHYHDSGHWREAVRQLVERGLLVRVRGGVRRGMV